MKEYKNFFFDMDGVLASRPVLPGKMGTLQFVNNDNFFQKLSPVPQVKEIVDRLISKGKNVYILSATPNSICADDKTIWLGIHYPNIEKGNIFYVNSGAHKAQMYSELQKYLGLNKYESVLVEDTQHIIESVRKDHCGNAVHVSEFLTELYDY